jgi:hypothetical protein
MSLAWFQTFSGIKFDLLEPSVEMIEIDDIAHSLSQVNRFTGHCKFPYPVSQHSRIGSFLVPENDALWFLLHDASEAYLGDMSSPLKHYTPVGDEYKKIEHKIQNIICDRFSIDREKPKSIKQIDGDMYTIERDVLLKGRFNYLITETSFQENKRLYLDRYYSILKLSNRKIKAHGAV